MNPTANTILIADDDVGYAMQACRKLERSGYKTLTAESQHEAGLILDRIKPDLAIIDLKMETEDSGFILCYKLKKRYPDVPVIIVSDSSKDNGFSLDFNDEKTRKWIRADSFLEKSLKMDGLLDEIKKLLRK